MGRPKKIIPPNKFYCLYCGKEKNVPDYIAPLSKREPICMDCLLKLYSNFLLFYIEKGYSDPQRLAIKRVCMACNWYFSDSIFDETIKKRNPFGKPSLVDVYMKKMVEKGLALLDYDTSLSNDTPAADIENTKYNIAQTTKALERIQNVLDDLYLFDAEIQMDSETEVTET